MPVDRLSVFACVMASALEVTNVADLKKEIDMDTLFSIGQLLALTGIAYGAYLCFPSVRKIDAPSRTDVTAAMQQLQVTLR